MSAENNFRFFQNLPEVKLMIKSECEVRNQKQEANGFEKVLLLSKVIIHCIDKQFYNFSHAMWKNLPVMSEGRQHGVLITFQVRKSMIVHHQKGSSKKKP